MLLIIYIYQPRSSEYDLSLSPNPGRKKSAKLNPTLCMHTHGLIQSHTPLTYIYRNTERKRVRERERENH